MMRRGWGGWRGEEGGLNKEKTFPFLQEKGIYSFKAFGCIFSSAISSFASSLPLPFSYPFILPVILCIPRLSLCSPLHRRPEMKPLLWIMYPQSKRLKSGLSHCVCVCLKREEALLWKHHATTPGAFKIWPLALWTQTVCKQQPSDDFFQNMHIEIWIFIEELVIHSRKRYFLYVLINIYNFFFIGMLTEAKGCFRRVKVACYM